MSSEACALSLSYLRYCILDLFIFCFTPIRSYLSPTLYFPLYLYLHHSPCTLVIFFTQCINKTAPRDHGQHWGQSFTYPHSIFRPGYIY